MEYVVALRGLSIVVQTLFSMERLTRAKIFYVDDAEILMDVKLLKVADKNYRGSFARYARNVLVSRLRLPHVKHANYTLVYFGDRYLQMLVLVFDDLVNVDKMMLYEYDGATQTGACYMAEYDKWVEEQPVRSVHVFERILEFCKDHVYFTGYGAGENRLKFKEAVREIRGLGA